MPRESEPPLAGPPTTRLRANPRTGIALALIGLVPCVLTILLMLSCFLFESLFNDHPVAMVAALAMMPLVANALVGIGVRRVVERRSSAWSIALAAAGWFVAVIGTGIFFAVLSQFDPRFEGGQGLGIALTFPFLIGVVASPVAALAAGAVTPPRGAHG